MTAVVSDTHKYNNNNSNDEISNKNNSICRIKGDGREKVGCGCYNNNNRLQSPILYCSVNKIHLSSSLYNSDNDNDDNNKEKNITSTTAISNNNLILNCTFLKSSTYLSKLQIY